VVPDNGFEKCESISKGTDWLGAHITIAAYSEDNKAALRKFIDVYRTTEQFKPVYNMNPIATKKWNPNGKDVKIVQNGERYDINSKTLNNLKEVLKAAGASSDSEGTWHIYCKTGLPILSEAEWRKIDFSVIMIKKTGKTITWLEDTRTPFLDMTDANKDLLIAKLKK
jgi:predicted transcriptional regulator